MDDTEVSPEEMALVCAVLQELFTLLEEHAPVWYTEGHHNRAVAALHAVWSKNSNRLK